MKMPEIPNHIECLPFFSDEETPEEERTLILNPDGEEIGPFQRSSIFIRNEIFRTFENIPGVIARYETDGSINLRWKEKSVIKKQAQIPITLHILGRIHTSIMDFLSELDLEKREQDTHFENQDNSEIAFMSLNTELTENILELQRRIENLERKCHELIVRKHKEECITQKKQEGEIKQLNEEIDRELKRIINDTSRLKASFITGFRQQIIIPTPPTPIKIPRAISWLPDNLSAIDFDRIEWP